MTREGAEAADEQQSNPPKGCCRIFRQGNLVAELNSVDRETCRGEVEPQGGDSYQWKEGNCE